MDAQNDPPSEWTQRQVFSWRARHVVNSPERVAVTAIGMNEAWRHFVESNLLRGDPYQRAVDSRAAAQATGCRGTLKRGTLKR
jgi:hypothetical protein